jgi:hypothetical protein
MPTRERVTIVRAGPYSGDGFSAEDIARLVNTLASAHEQLVKTMAEAQSARMDSAFWQAKAHDLALELDKARRQGDHWHDRHDAAWARCKQLESALRRRNWGTEVAVS